jgi:hypothetical protein
MVHFVRVHLRAEALGTGSERKRTSLARGLPEATTTPQHAPTVTHRNALPGTILAPGRIERERFQYDYCSTVHGCGEQQYIRSKSLRHSEKTLKFYKHVQKKNRACSPRKKQVLKKAKIKRQNYAQTERNHLIYILEKRWGRTGR